MSRIYFMALVALVYVAFDIYIFQALRVVMSDYSVVTRRVLTIVYFAISAVLFVGISMYNQLDPKQFANLRLFITTAFFITLLGKLISALFIFVDDGRRLFTWIANFLPSKAEETPDLSRSEFLSKSALIAGTVPIAVFSFGIVSGAHDYRVRKTVITSSKVPKAFHGIRLAQISDIHTGSFFNKTAVAGGVDMLNAEKPDLVFFTGDLVNNQSDEAKPYLDIFKSITAPLGVYSTMGNHDYGDYRSWTSPEAKQADIKQLHEMHRYMGWDILLNENRIITQGSDQLAILGLENWGAGRFSKYGDLAKTYKGTEEVPFKILLSHDPSHWEAQVLPEYPDINLHLAGHTHGMQFGIEIGDFRWSPSKYIYKQWADMYQSGNQYLYVNRGYGYLGYPGRVGILPEVTIIELRNS
ncbi:metallophosphoesterase [Marinoscillum pacificum]|uniref:metallophosphoesterase n=1 Tax=Marinoscillum pacificum TaxID=392723 RepID=UPI0021580A63|nr:metallophosphoesterase [Marinoscillum pacificum]